MTTPIGTKSHHALRVMAVDGAVMLVTASGKNVMTLHDLDVVIDSEYEGLNTVNVKFLGRVALD